MTDKPSTVRPSTPATKSFDPSRLALLIQQRDEGNVTAAARRTKVAQPTLYNILKGTYKPRADTLGKLAKAYGVSFDFISGRDERAEDDTFASGARAAVRAMRRELDRIEEAIDSENMGPRQPRERAVPGPLVEGGDLPPGDHPARGIPKGAARGERSTKPVPALQKRRGKRA